MLILYDDVGDFGSGAESTRQIVVTAHYQVNHHLHLLAGYHRSSVDYLNAGKGCHNDGRAAAGGDMAVLNVVPVNPYDPALTIGPPRA